MRIRYSEAIQLHHTLDFFAFSGVFDAFDDEDGGITVPAVEIPARTETWPFHSGSTKLPPLEPAPTAPEQQLQGEEVRDWLARQLDKVVIKPVKLNSTSYTSRDVNLTSPCEIFRPISRRPRGSG